MHDPLRNCGRWSHVGVENLLVPNGQMKLHKIIHYYLACLAHWLLVQACKTVGDRRSLGFSVVYGDPDISANSHLRRRARARSVQGLRQLV